MEIKSKELEALEDRLAEELDDREEYTVCVLIYWGS